MVWNDLIDSKIDREVSRTKNRPIAAGRVTAKQALAWIMVQFLASWYLVHCTLGGQKV
jgi:4-hydroxybenzoate polyprenyltransferase